MSLIIFAAVSCAVSDPGRTASGNAGQIPTFFTIDEMPDLVSCLPPPPDWHSGEFAYDSLRYFWGKECRSDLERAAQAKSDAVWTLEALFTSFNEAFGMALSPQATPEIWKLLEMSVSTIDLIRIRPKARFNRTRPFVYFGDQTLMPSDDDELRGEGSYPSGHTIRGWSVALLLAQVNPSASGPIFTRGWEYGESRVIVGAHWQSDVDASRLAASIGYGKLQTSKAFHRQMGKAQAEYRRLSSNN